VPGNNLQRFFADVVSVAAWHTPFDGTHVQVDLHADVVFRTARVGGESASPVRFRLGIKRAEVILRIAPTEPVEIIPSSVSRDDPLSHGRLTLTVGSSATRASNVRASAAVGRNVGVGVSLGAEGSKSLADTQAVSVDRPSSAANVLQTKTADGQYRWELTPVIGDVLEGRGWDAATAPRARLKDTRMGAKSLPPTVSIEVVCAKEDISITDISVKQDGSLRALNLSFNNQNRRAAAEAYIRSKLSEIGLTSENFDDPFGVVRLADVLARPVNDV
jgi:hypothetical protein